MSDVQWTMSSIVGHGGSALRVLAVVIDGAPVVCTSEHPFWSRIERLLQQDPLDGHALAALVGAGTGEALAELCSEHVTAQVSWSPSTGAVLVGGVPVPAALAERLHAGLSADDPARWGPLAALLERIAAGMDSRAASSFAEWICHQEASVLPDGRLLAWKGLGPDGLSVHAGSGSVDGVLHDRQRLPNRLGSVVSMDADEVVGLCAPGLHVSDREFAYGFGSGPVALVAVDPSAFVDSRGGVPKAVVREYQVLAHLPRNGGSVPGLVPSGTVVL